MGFMINMAQYGHGFFYPTEWLIIGRLCWNCNCHKFATLIDPWQVTICPTLIARAVCKLQTTMAKYWVTNIWGDWQILRLVLAAKGKIIWMFDTKFRLWWRSSRITSHPSVFFPLQGFWSGFWRPFGNKKKCFILNQLVQLELLLQCCRKWIHHMCCIVNMWYTHLGFAWPRVEFSVNLMTHCLVNCL